MSNNEMQELSDKLRRGLQLADCAMIFATAVGIPVGVLAAVKCNQFLQTICRNDDIICIISE